MRKIILVAVFLLATFLIIQSSTALASEGNEAESSATIYVEKKGDVRIEKLEGFLASYNSPLAKYAFDFVKIADYYGLDWKLIPAIAGVESTFGKVIPPSSFNAYGWANGNYWFTSWKVSIEIVAKSLKSNYFNRGADTVEEIAPIYAPPSRTWAWKVRYFMEKIENFSSTNPLALELSL